MQAHPKTKRVRNDFLLPDELGWECNDEISKVMDDWFNTFTAATSILGKDAISINEASMLWQVSKAQLMDDVYAVIKKYQKKVK